MRPPPKSERIHSRRPIDARTADAHTQRRARRSQSALPPPAASARTERTTMMMMIAAGLASKAKLAALALARYADTIDSQ